MTEERHVVKCARCALVQFENGKNQCRRCHEPIQVIVPCFDRKPPDRRFIVNSANLAKAVGVVLIGVRYRANMSQEQAAEKYGCPRTYISKLERGHVTPTIITLHRFCAPYG